MGGHVEDISILNGQGIILRLQTASPGKQGVSRISGQQVPFSKQSRSQEQVPLSMLRVQFVLGLGTQHESNPAETQDPNERDRHSHIAVNNWTMVTYRHQGNIK